MQDRTLIVGLGNPGRKYAQTRHNVGFMTVDAIARAHNIALGGTRHNTIVGLGRVGRHPVILAKPLTYMNRSGDGIGPVANYYRVPAERLLVIYDELDLPFGTLRLRPSGGAGGHNGMRSIIQHVGDGFPRLRIGIGRPPGRIAPADYVLMRFSKAEEAVVPDLLSAAVHAIEAFLEDGIERAMSRHNGSVLP